MNTVRVLEKVDLLSSEKADVEAVTHASIFLHVSTEAVVYARHVYWALRCRDIQHTRGGAALMHKCSFPMKTGRKREMTQVQVGLRMWWRKDEGVTVDRFSFVIEE